MRSRVSLLSLRMKNPNTPPGTTVLFSTVLMAWSLSFTTLSPLDSRNLLISSMLPFLGQPKGTFPSCGSPCSSRLTGFPSQCWKYATKGSIPSHVGLAPNCTNQPWSCKNCKKFAASRAVTSIANGSRSFMMHCRPRTIQANAVLPVPQHMSMNTPVGLQNWLTISTASGRDICCCRTTCPSTVSFLL